MKTDVKRTIIRGRRKRFEWSWVYLLLPFYYIYLGAKWLWDNILIHLFFETTDSGWNGVFGPGGRSHTITTFSWGKLSFIIALISLILVIIYII